MEKIPIYIIAITANVTIVDGFWIDNNYSVSIHFGAIKILQLI